MPRSEKFTTTYSIIPGKDKAKKDKSPYCELCKGTTHTKKDCIFAEDLDFEECEVSDPGLGVQFLNEPEVDSSTLVDYGTEQRTITGVMRILRETGNEEGAELLQQMDEVAKTTRQLCKTTKRKRRQLSSEEDKPEKPKKNPK